MTIEQINKFQEIVREYNNGAVPFEDLQERCKAAKLETVLDFLLNNHYLGKMNDGNTFFNWSKNKYYPEATIINLKTELTNKTRPLTIEERVAILEEDNKKLREELELIRSMLREC